MVSHEGVLVDGGVLDNLPADVMAPRGRPAQVRGARERLLGAHPDAPGIAESLSRATALASWRVSQANRELADLMIVPTIPDAVKVLAFHQLDRLIAAGRKAAEQALATTPGLAP